MQRLQDEFYTICHDVAKQLGAGHSEAVYQKACGQFLQANHVSHHLEQHVPVVVTVPTVPTVPTSLNPSASQPQVFHIGDERIDILMNDNGNVHVAELKAIGAKVTPTKVTPQLQLSASHVQLLKYVRLLQKDVTYQSQLTTGYVVNFRQHATQGAPYDMTVEFDVYDVLQQKWHFGYTPDALVNVVQ